MGDRAGAVVDPRARRRGLRSVRTRPKRSARGQSSSAMRLKSLSLSEAVAVSSAVASCGWRTCVNAEYRQEGNRMDGCTGTRNPTERENSMNDGREV